ncbi:MAG: class I SAM-dependent methyltransferase [Candidatus Omnitrophica bacterium]|nr:class I SAM-dependent methyltransferase [Candidatus Omnitrophota bacterium]
MINRQEGKRLDLFKMYGYDIPKARNFVLFKAGKMRGRILEVGTGRGHMAAALAKSGFRLVSIDLDREAQKSARANLKTLKLEKAVTFRIMNAEKLLYQDNCFDYLLSVNFIHHAENPVKCLKEMVRVSKIKIILADLNKRGEKIMEKVHALDGHRHAASKMTMFGARDYLREAGLMTKIYRDVCQTVIVAEKKPGLI